MGQYTSYWLYQRYEQRGEQEPIPYYPNTYSVDGDGTMQLVVRMEDDEQCGYIPPYEPIYRWIQTMDTVCINDGKKLKATYGDGSVYELVCNENTRLTRDETNPSGYQASAMTSAEIGDCVTSIGVNAFRRFSDLTDVLISDTVNWIADGAFQGCNSLTRINSGVYGIFNLPSGVTHIGAAAFSGTSLTSIVIPNNVTYIGSDAFSNCTSLTSVVIPTGLTFFDTYAFSECKSLTSVTLPNDIVSIPDNTFFNCISLTSIDIPNSVTRIGNEAFWRCSSLTSVTIPNSVTSIGPSVFQNCSNLTSITVLATIPPTLEQVGLIPYSEEFENTNGCPIYVPCESVETYKSYLGWREYADRIEGIPPCDFKAKWLARYSDGHTESAECDDTGEIVRNEITKENLVSVKIGNCVTSIGDGVFSYCSGLKSVTIPNSVTSIDSGVFYECIPITSVTIPNSVTSIGTSAFRNSSTLRVIWIGTGITSIGSYAFYYSKRIYKIVINATTPPTLGEEAFVGINSFTIRVPEECVDIYKTAEGWSQYANNIGPIQP